MGKAQRSVGFTLVELLAAVAIVGVLVTLAVPRFRVFIAKARQSEASINLGIIAKLQQSYYNEYGKYYNESSFKMGKGGGGGSCPTTNVNELGFRTIKCSKLRYTYTSRSGGGGGAINDGLTTNHIYPGCSGAGKVDEWHISIERDLTNHQNVIKKCQD